MCETSINDINEVNGEYTLIPVVSTPKINQGGKITLDYYVAGRHPDGTPPEFVRLNVNLDGIIIKSAHVTQNIAQRWADDGTRIALKKEKGLITHTLPDRRSVFSLKLPETMFLPNPDSVNNEDPYSSPPLHGELGIDGEDTPPFRLEIQTEENQAAGDHEITSTLIYQQDKKAGTDRITNQIHVNTTYEEYQFWINALIITLTLIGVFSPVLLSFLRSLFL